MYLSHQVLFSSGLYIVTCWLLLCSDSLVSASLLPAGMTSKMKYGDTKLIQYYTQDDRKQKKHIVKADK